MVTAVMVPLHVMDLYPRAAELKHLDSLDGSLGLSLEFVIEDHLKSLLKELSAQRVWE